MENEFTSGDLNFLLQCVTYSKKKFEEYPYDNEVIRKDQIEKADQMLKKLRAIIKG